MGRVSGAGMRGYVLFAGGLDIPAYLGSASTFTLGQFGGHAARALVAGDVLHLAQAETGAPALAEGLPEMGKSWEMRVLYGPHGAPDFFTPDDIAPLPRGRMAGALQFQPHRCAAGRPQAQWARRDGGEAGLHPSNNPRQSLCYRRGGFYRGDMPIILGPDGPSLGGFVCPFTVIAADRLEDRAIVGLDDRVRFVPVTIDDAMAADPAPADRKPAPIPARAIGELPPNISPNCLPRARVRAPPTASRGTATSSSEYGDIVLDIELRESASMR